jgi:hypothetical protein
MKEKPKGLKNDLPLSLEKLEGEMISCLWMNHIEAATILCKQICEIRAQNNYTEDTKFSQELIWHARLFSQDELRNSLGKYISRKPEGKPRCGDCDKCTNPC